MAPEDVSSTRLSSSGSTTNAEVDNFRPKEIFTEEMFYYFGIFMLMVVGSVIAVFGVVSNVINVIVYYEQGVKDSVTVTFIALSIWDFGNCFTSCISIVFFVIGKHFPIATVDVLAVQYVYVGYTRGCIQIMSTIVTMYLSVERCICIIIPLKVKRIFTKSRSIFINAGICVFSCASFCPYWATQGLQWRFEDKFNNTRLELWLSNDRPDVNIFMDTFNGVFILTMAQVVVTVSVVFMLSGIKTSAKFRHKSAGHLAVKDGQSGTQSSETHEKSKTKDKFMSSKDSRWTKVVVLVAVIFFICNVPPLILQVVKALIPEVEFGKTYNNLNQASNILVYDFSLINSSATIFVYYSVSTKFKEVFLSLLSNTKILGTR